MTERRERYEAGGEGEPPLTDEALASYEHAATLAEFVNPDLGAGIRRLLREVRRLRRRVLELEASKEILREGRDE